MTISAIGSQKRKLTCSFNKAGTHGLGHKGLSNFLDVAFASRAGAFFREISASNIPMQVDV